MLDIAAHAGRRAALAAIIAIVAGGLILYALVHAGLDAWVIRKPWIERLFVAVSSAYLAWLGGVLLYRSSLAAKAPVERSASMSALGLLGFQFVNPKAWLLMISLSSAAQCAPTCTATDELITASLLLIIPTTSLLGWLFLSAGVGRLARLDFDRPSVRRVAGTLLLASALSMVREMV